VNTPGTVLLQTPAGWRLYRDPIRVVQTRTVAEIPAALAAVDAAVAGGLHAAGFLAYEAAPAFDPAYVAHPGGALPLLWFGLYPAAHEAPDPRRDAPEVPPLAWKPSVDFPAYRAAIAHIKAAIAAGATYQVNYTLRLRAPFAGDPWALFRALGRAQDAGCAAYVHLDRFSLCSASPELFFARHGDAVVTRPMKGTAPRGTTWADDEAQARALHRSVKNRAENVMIVDMLRNDLGRVAETGSVEVAELFTVERYRTVLQMTSTVRARTHASFGALLGALFPCASITGAPKVETMRLIRALEPEPRGIYTGAIGYVEPGAARFNVAIRTVCVDREAGTAEYGTGGGIVWDSVAEEEYAETRTKALVLTTPFPVFQLLETLRWQPGLGYRLLREHLARLHDSARYFGYRVEMDAVLTALREAASTWRTPQRVRLLAAEDGTLTLTATPVTRERRPWRVAWAPEPVDPSDRFLYHKTTLRARYEAARAAHPACDDVLLWNTRGEATESTIANLVVRRDGRLLTPPVTSGLLPGAARAHLLAAGHLREAVLTREDVACAEAAYLVNSVRGWMRIDLV
jgi:para-aminobenzoate synthetase/4-amino-4-deoxychorismate lyase